MKPLVVLLTTFSVSLLIMWLFSGVLYYVWAGNVGMSVMLLFTSMGHFKFRKGMAMMVPDVIPFKSWLVIVTGCIEAGMAIALLIPSLRYIASILLIIFFVLILPANINAALKNVDYQQGNYDGPGTQYLWFRIPLQLLFIGWVWFFGIQLA